MTAHIFDFSPLRRLRESFDAEAVAGVALAITTVASAAGLIAIEVRDGNRAMERVQAASAAEQFDSVRAGTLKLRCIDAVTGRSYNARPDTVTAMQNDLERGCEFRLP